MHKWLENYVLNGETGDPGSHPASKQSHQMAHTVIQQGLSNCDEFWGTEVSLYFPQIYAGTTDLVGLHTGDGAIMDTNRLTSPRSVNGSKIISCS